MCIYYAFVMNVVFNNNNKKSSKKNQLQTIKIISLTKTLKVFSKTSWGPEVQLFLSAAMEAEKQT